MTDSKLIHEPYSKVANINNGIGFSRLRYAKHALKPLCQRAYKSGPFDFLPGLLTLLSPLLRYPAPEGFGPVALCHSPLIDNKRFLDLP